MAGRDLLCWMNGGKALVYEELPKNLARAKFSFHTTAILRISLLQQAGGSPRLALVIFRSVLSGLWLVGGG